MNGFLGQNARCVSVLFTCLMLGACGLGSQNLRGDSPTLRPCGGGPHCVSSFDPDESRHIEPIPYAGLSAAIQQKLLAVLESMRGTEVVINQPGYVHAEVTTSIFRYVDDLEFLFEEDRNWISVRSSSRIGYYDFEVNRERVELIREKMQSCGSTSCR